MGEVLDSVKAYAAQIDTATNAIGDRIQKLIDQIAAGQISVADVQAALQPEVDKLNAMGKDPAAAPSA